MPSSQTCHAIAQYGRCPLALSGVSPGMRFSVECVGDGFRLGRMTLRVRFTGRLVPERHLTLVMDEALFRRCGIHRSDIIAASAWWLLRPQWDNFHAISLHLVTNATCVDFFGEVAVLTTSLSMLSWQLTRLELPYMPHLHTLELRNCLGLTDIVLAPSWETHRRPGHSAAPPLRVLDLTETKVRSLGAITRLFPALETLHVDGVTSIEDWDAARFGLCQLRELNATATNLVNISWLQHLKRLETLKLHGCVDIRDWSPVGALHRLRNLNCNYGTLTSMDWISSCAQLEKLVMYGCQGLTDGSAIGQLSNLQRLNIGLHNLHTVSWLRHCSRLQSLQMQGATDVVVEGMDSIGELHELEELNLSYSAVRDISWLPGCTALRQLYLVGCSHVQDWRPLGTLMQTATALELVDLREANVTGVRDLVRASSRLQELRLEDANLTMQDRLALSTLPASVRLVL